MLTHQTIQTTARNPLANLSRALGIVTVLALLVICSGTVGALSNGTQHFSGAFSMTFFDDCTGENVDINVTIEEDVHFVADSSGGVHLDIHDVYSGRGIGEITGTLYNANQTDTISFNGRIGQEATQPLHFSMISKGGTANFVVQLLFHITVNANGSVTAFVNSAKASCK